MEKESKYTNVDWSKPNIAIARELNVTREAVRQARQRLGLPKVPRSCYGRTLQRLKLVRSPKLIGKSRYAAENILGFRLRGVLFREWLNACNESTADPVDVSGPGSSGADDRR